MDQTPYRDYRDPSAVRKLADEIAALLPGPIGIMEVCGGQTHALARYGIEELLPPELRLIHGPGCPVCVTSIGLIDTAISLALEPDVILCSYGDMLRVPGTNAKKTGKGSLLSAKAAGADVRFLYSPTDAVTIAQDNPGKRIVFFAVGFETTAPASALAVKTARHKGITNFSLLTAHVLVPPVLNMLLDTPDREARPSALLAPGHVCAITGEQEYAAIASKHRIPVSITGFEPVDLMLGIRSCVSRIAAAKRGDDSSSFIDNQYARAVRSEGNPIAADLMREVFAPCDRIWRGLGLIPGGGMQLRPEWSDFDAISLFNLPLTEEQEPPSACIAGDILRGIKRPHQCPAFGKECTPLTPLGAPMVSGEGACAAYFRYKKGIMNCITPFSQSHFKE